MSDELYRVLCEAITSGDTVGAVAAIRAGSPSKPGAFALAIRFGRVEVLRALLDAGGDPNAGFQDRSLLHHAASVDEGELGYAQVDAMITMLLEAGADATAPAELDSGRRTALQCAAARGSVDAVRVLASALVGAGEHATDALRAAAGSAHALAKVEVLLEHGADPRRTDALVDACANPRGRDAAFRLLAAGAAQDAADANGCTPLHAAVASGAAELVAELVRRGATADAATRRAVRDLDLRKGETARDVAIRRARFAQAQAVEDIVRALGVPVSEVARFCGPQPPNEAGTWNAAAAYAASRGDASAANRASEPSCRTDIEVPSLPRVRSFAAILELLEVDLDALTKPTFRPGTWTLRRVEVDGTAVSLKKWLRGKPPHTLNIDEDGSFRAHLGRRKLEGTWTLNVALVLQDRKLGPLETELDHEGIVLSEWSAEEVVTRSVFVLA